MLLAAGALIPTRPRAVVVRLAGRGLGEYRGLVLSTLGLVIGGLMFVAGLSAHSDPLYTFGFSLLVVCVVFYMANATSLSPRLLWTAASLLLLWFWLTPGDVLQRIVGKMDGDIEMFFVSGVWVVAATTLLLIYNADLMLKAIHAVGGRFARILPALDMAVVYPLANRLRTGLTLAMFSLIMFSLVFMAVIQASYLEAFGSRDAAGHWDVLVTTSPNTQINDLRAAVDESGGDSSALETVGQVTLATLFGTEVRQETLPGDPGAAPGEPGVVGLWGGDREFLENNRMPIQIRAEGYDTSQEVWAALADDPSLAVVDHSWVAVEGFGEETPIRLEGVDRDATIMKPVDLAVTNPQGGPPTRLKVIGVIDTSVLLVRGLFTSQEAVSALYGEGDLQQFFVRLEEGTDDREAANDIEASLFEQGIQSESLNEVLVEFTAEGRGFLYLMEGFMSLGLLVGVASLGVISLRAVVERRQQIGMLRAIGFRRALVSTTFILESAFVSLAGVAAGVITSLVLAYNVLNSQYAGGAADIPYTVPVDQVILFSSLAVIASLLMTWLAAARASRVPVAEALRYE
jgi:putative ABC transport system permease protein